MAHLCARCEHHCEQGIKFTRFSKDRKTCRLIFRCSECKHETTMIRVPKDVADGMENE